MPSTPKELALARAMLDGWVVYGIANTGKLDLTGERLDIPTVDFAPLLERGVFNDGHKSGEDNELGPLLQAGIKQGDDGSQYLEVWGVLDPTNKRAQEIHQHLLNGGKMGLSVEGSRGIEKKADDGYTDLLHACTWAVAITPNPADPRTHVALMKDGKAHMVGEVSLAKDFSLAPGGNENAAQIENLSSRITSPIVGGNATQPKFVKGKLWGGCKDGRNHYTDGTLAKGAKGVLLHLKDCHGISYTDSEHYIQALLTSLKLRLPPPHQFTRSYP